MICTIKNTPENLDTFMLMYQIDNLELNNPPTITTYKVNELQIEFETFSIHNLFWLTQLVPSIINDEARVKQIINTWTKLLMVMLSNYNVPDNEIESTLLSYQWEINSLNFSKPVPTQNPFLISERYKHSATDIVASIVKISNTTTTDITAAELLEEWHKIKQGNVS